MADEKKFVVNLTRSDKEKVEFIQSKAEYAPSATAVVKKAIDNLYDKVVLSQA